MTNSKILLNILFKKPAFILHTINKYDVPNGYQIIQELNYSYAFAYKTFKELEWFGLINYVLVGSKRQITFTERGKDVVKCINKIMEAVK